MKKLLVSAVAVMAVGACVYAADEKPVELFPVIQGGKWGYMDKAGKVVIAPKYEGAWDFSEGLASVQVGALRGYIDEKGTMVIKPEYAMTRPFSEGKAAVVVGAGKFDKTMDLRGAQWKYIDKTGKILFEKTNNRFAIADEFHGGEARVKFEFNVHLRSSLINSNGVVRQFVSKPVGRVSEGVVAWPLPKGYGYVDGQGKEVIPGEYEAAGDFSDGLAKVKKNKKWGFIDKTGKRAFEADFDAAGDFSEGLASVQVGGKWGCIDRTGKTVIEAQFDFVAPFSDGLARVVKGGKHGYMDKTGKIVVEPKFDGAWDFAKGLARVVVGDKEGYIDKTGKYVWEPKESPYGEPAKPEEKPVK
ncbi:MAG: hypothetical protein C0404_09980 [Verrucomicrobia bacterium]|nr:hypothetical protein [Verrucomicrobiota bacterium]